MAIKSCFYFLEILSEANSMGVQIFVVPFLILLDVWGVEGGQGERGREREINFWIGYGFHC